MLDGQLVARIDEWMKQHKEELVQDIKTLVRIPSVSDANDPQKPYGQACRDVLDAMIEIAKGYGFETENVDYHCGAMWLGEKNRDVERAIGIWGHLDVVPAGNDWIGEPFVPAQKEEFLLGRGARDNKGPAVAALFVARCLRDLGIELDHPLRIYAGCNEEVGMADMAYFTAHQKSPLLNLICDCGFPVCYAEKGIIDAQLVSQAPLSDVVLSFSGGVAANMVPDRARIELAYSKDLESKCLALSAPDISVTVQDGRICVEATGISKHTAFPQNGVSAIQRLVTVLLDAKVLPEADSTALGFMTVAGADFAGTGLGIVCEDELSGALTCVGSRCWLDGERRPVMHINIRYPVRADCGWIQSQISKACSQNGYEMRLERDSKPNDFPREHPVVDRLTDVFQQLTGSDKGPYVMGGGTYARKLPRALAYGMGGVPGFRGERDILPEGHGGAHEPDEALNVDALLAGAKIFCVALMEADKLDL